MSSTGDFAAIGLTLYVAHHVGDYWVQRDCDARGKADAGLSGHLHCLIHVLTYVITQTLFLGAVGLVTGVRSSVAGFGLGLLVSGVTHYIADRQAPLARIVSWIPGKSDFLKVGMPRKLRVDARWVDDQFDAVLDNPQLATGMWALDQSWHVFWGVFVAALIMVGVR